MLQAALLTASLCGYLLLLYILCSGRKTALYPAVAVSAITALSLPAAYAGVLYYFYRAVFFGGFAALALGALYLWKADHDLDDPEITQLYPLALFAVLALAAFPLLSGRFLQAYDDFTHWGTVARAVAVQYRLPAEADLLKNTSYPPASALFIGYVSSVLGSSGGVWIWAQTMMLLSFWVALLSAGKDIIRQAVLTVFLLLFVNYSVSPESLYVDNLLAAAAFAALMTCLGDEEITGGDFLSLGIVLSAMALIKSSALLFLVMIAVLAVCLYIRSERSLCVWMPALLLPLLFLLLWQSYVGSTFESGSNFEISVSNYRAILSAKTAEDVAYTVRLILSIAVNPMRNHALLLVPAFAAVAAALHMQGELRGRRHLLVFSAVLLVAYQVGILLVYLLGMPMTDVLFQNGQNYDRFNGTLVAVLAGVLLYLVCCVRIPDEEAEHLRQWIAPAALAMAAALMTAGVLAVSYQPIRSISHRAKENQTAEHYARMETQLSALPDGGHYIVLLCDEDTDGYHKYISRYYLRTKDVTLIYDRQEALELAKQEPWRCYIDLCAGTIQEATQTLGVELFAESYSSRYENKLATVGYKENTRYSVSSAADVSITGWDITGYIPAKAGDVINLHNVGWSPTYDNEGRGGVYWYDKDMNYLSCEYFLEKNALSRWSPVYNIKGDIVQITIPKHHALDAVYFRIVAQDIRHLSVITVNEEIR